MFCALDAESGDVQLRMEAVAGSVEAELEDLRLLHADHPKQAQQRIARLDTLEQENVSAGGLRPDVGPSWR